MFKQGTKDDLRKALSNAIFLEDESVNIMGYNIYGCPWIKSDLAIHKKEGGHHYTYEKIPA